MSKPVVVAEEGGAGAALREALALPESGGGTVQRRLSDRVSAMLASIEAELDQVGGWRGVTGSRLLEEQIQQ